MIIKRKKENVINETMTCEQTIILCCHQCQQLTVSLQYNIYNIYTYIYIYKNLFTIHGYLCTCTHIINRLVSVYLHVDVFRVETDFCKTFKKI